MIATAAMSDATQLGLPNKGCAIKELEQKQEIGFLLLLVFKREAFL